MPFGIRRLLQHLTQPVVLSHDTVKCPLLRWSKTITLALSKHAANFNPVVAVVRCFMRSGQAKVAFIASLCLASFAYGMATVYWQVFPFTVLQNADRAWGAIDGPSPPINNPAVRCRRSGPNLTEPAIHSYSNAAGDELVLVAGGKDYLKQHSPEHGCLAWIMDRQGNVVHVWHYDPEIWAHLERVATVPGISRRVYPVGMHLYPDGDLLVSFQGHEVFPYGIGLARFDKDSKLLWKKELFSHHWFTVAPDGRIITPAVRLVESPRQIGNTRFSLSSPDGKVCSK